MGTKTLDKHFDAAPLQRWRGLTEQALVDYEFTVSDPESVSNLSLDPPTDDNPEVEARYDMSGREVQVRCCYCRHPNHNKGIVVRSRDGTRHLVGRDCALKHHGVAFEKGLVEFEAAVEAAGYARRRRALLQAGGRVHALFDELKAHPAVSTYDRTLWTWRNRFSDLAASVVNVARRGESLVREREVRDVEGEKARRARLGDRFEEERRKVKDAGGRWQLFKCVRDDLGPLEGAPFFAAGVNVRKRLEEIEDAVRATFRFLSAESLRPSQIRAGLAKLGDLRASLVVEHDRLDALPAAFTLGNLGRIARWANEQAADQIRREAEEDGVRMPTIYDRFAIEDGGIIDQRTGAVASIPAAYRSPSRTLIAALKDATSLDHEP